MAGPAAGADLGVADKSSDSMVSLSHPAQQAIKNGNRIIQSCKRAKKETVEFSATNTISHFEFTAGGKGNSTKLNELIWFIANLKDIIIKQSQVIKVLKAE